MALTSVFKRSKRGNVVLDSFFYFMAIIIFILIAVTGSYILGQINSDIQTDSDMDNQTKEIIDNMNTNYPSWFDYGAATVIVLLWIVVLVASFYVDTHPVFFIVSAIVLMIAVFAVNQFIEAIDDYFAEPEIEAVLSGFPISVFLVNNIEKFIAIVGFSIAIALYAKFKA